jgi:hypothetical protein
VLYRSAVGGQWVVKDVIDGTAEWDAISRDQAGGRGQNLMFPV